MLVFKAPDWHIIGHDGHPVPPRDWQRAAYETVTQYMAGSDVQPAVLSAIMGAGKSVLIDELSATVELGGDEVVVVSTSTELLVENLYGSIKRRVRYSRPVGVWYGRKKRMGAIIVTCIPSVPALSRKLESAGKKVALWIADEVHRTECSTILSTYELLSPGHSIGMTATAFRSSKSESITLFDNLIYRYGVQEAQKDGVVVPWRIVHAEQGEELDESCLAMVHSASGPGLANAVSIEDADNFARVLSESGVEAAAIHSKLPPWRRLEIITGLRSGMIRCAVHVNMLAEGANFPWLRWLLLRRQVESRVRFVQEIGRLLRSYPGKEEAVFYDPHDLFGSFKLTYREALGEIVIEDDPTPQEILGDVTRICDPDPAIVMEWIESVIRTLVVACEASGMLLAGRKLVTKIERIKPSTALQHAALSGRTTKKALKIAPEIWHDAIALIVERPDMIRYGFAADMLVALDAIVLRKEWPPVDPAGRISAVPNTVQELPTLIEKNGQTAVDVEKL